MTSTWILVANSAQAVLYANTGPKKGLQKIKELAHEQSREKAAELVTDRPGHNQGHGNGHGSFVPAKTPKEVEADRFALELARELDTGRTHQSYQRLILVASPQFMGRLNLHIGPHVRQMVSDTIEKDYTRASTKELARHLEGCIYL